MQLFKAKKFVMSQIDNNVCGDIGFRALKTSRQGLVVAALHVLPQSFNFETSTIFDSYLIEQFKYSACFNFREVTNLKVELEYFRKF